MQDLLLVMKEDPFTALILGGGSLCAVVLVFILLYQTAILLFKR
jgi:hypothetical protein